MTAEALILNLPEQDSERAVWLEQQLVSDRLPELVAQLTMCSELSHSSDSSNDDFSVQGLVQEHGAAIFGSGLASLPAEVMHQLMQHPVSLHELQALVFANGGDYWDQIIQADSPVAKPNVSPASDRTSEDSGSKSKVGLWSVIALAAVLLIAVGSQMFSSGDNDLPSGLATASILKSEASAADYFSEIADAGEKWNETTFSDQTELLEGLAKFSDSCQKLIDAPHRPLDSNQKQWLKDKCGSWKGKIDSVHQRLAANQLDFKEASAEAEQIVTKLVTALRKQSQSV